MDKQKQIDISKVKSPEIRKRLEICEMENHINSGFDIAYKMQTSNFPNSIAETLYDAGYRKIPEIPKNTAPTNDDIAELLTVVARDTRKETAEKFAEMLKAEYAILDDECKLRIRAFTRDIDKVCKKITEGE